MSLIAQSFVGLVMLVAGVAKALFPSGFLLYVQALGVRQQTLAGTLVVVWVAFETALGIALLLGWRQALPMGLGVVLLLAVASAVMAFTKALGENGCGCFGGFVDLKPLQAVWLNLGCAVLLGLALFSPAGAGIAGFAPLVMVAAVLAGAGALASLLYLQRYQRPWFDPSPIRVGRHWNDEWLPAKRDDLVAGAQLVVFLSADCYRCKAWLRPLNVVNMQPQLPAVTGVLQGSAAQVVEFSAEHDLRFPMLGIDARRMTRLVKLGHPFAALLADGVITETWYGVMPGNFVDQLRAGRADR